MLVNVLHELLRVAIVCHCFASRVTLIENFASHAAVQEFVDVKPD